MASKSYEKLIEEIGGMSVLELADLVKQLETTFGVSAAMPVAAAGASSAAAEAAPAKEEAKSEYKVMLKDAGANKINVMKALRAVITGLNLSDAKKFTEEAPVVIAESASKADAEKMKKEIEAAGGKVELT